MAAISLRHVTKRFGEQRPAVDDVSLDIAEGELMILVGPSGCGKSTLLRMIAGLEEVTAGDVLLGGRRVNDVSPRDRDLAMVFQSYALYPHLTVFENIAFPLRVRGGLAETALRRRVEEAAATLELADLLHRRPGELSGGQRQRVAMGRAIVRHAEAFLFDEPLSNLDARLRAQMRLELLRLQRRLGTTTVYVTHDQTEAMTLGDRVAVLRGGVLQQVAAPRELYDRPANLFVAGFIGSPRMNLVPATVAGDLLAMPFVALTLPEDVRAAIGARRTVVAGIRPEGIEDASVPGAGVTFSARADVTEWLGHEQYAYVPYEAPPDASRAGALGRDAAAEAGPSQLAVALAPSRQVTRGAEILLRLDPRRIHLFDGESGTALAWAAAADELRVP
jgi:multiple sugar transport system ATP-binding protein